MLCCREDTPAHVYCLGNRIQIMVIESQSMPIYRWNRGFLRIMAEKIYWVGLIGWWVRVSVETMCTSSLCTFP